MVSLVFLFIGYKKDIFTVLLIGLELASYRLHKVQHHLPKATSLRSTSFAARRNIVNFCPQADNDVFATLKMMWASPNDVVFCGHK